MASELTLECIAIGSLPCENSDKAMEIVKRDFSNIPFWPQLTNVSKTEDMIIQFSDNMSFVSSISFPQFLKFVKDTKPKFAKGHITGPYTLSFTLGDMTDLLIQKAIWQINQIKSASPDTKPIIFIDEPSLSVLKISKDIPANMIKKLSDKIKENGAISGLHCCGDCDWSIAKKAGVDIISFDAYSYPPSKEFKNFIEQGGKIAWGVIPTKDKKALQDADLDKIIEVFENGVKYLTKFGIDEKIIIENSLITPSCGAGNLSEELAEKAMDLTKQLSDNRKALWHLNLQ